MKFEKSDHLYKERRKSFSENMGPRELWSIVDQWPLFCGIRNLGRFMAISDLLRETLVVPGHVAEFGSWFGANLVFMTKLLRLYDPWSAKEVHCFDSFEGLTTFTPEDDGDTGRGTYQGSLEQLLAVIELYELDDDITIHKGLIQDTLPAAVAANSALTFSFVYCDTDLYEPTQLILETLHPRLAKGGMFVFDEWNFARFKGEGLAANEFLEKHGEAYDVRHILGAFQPSLVIRKR